MSSGTSVPLASARPRLPAPPHPFDSLPTNDRNLSWHRGGGGAGIRLRGRDTGGLFPELKQKRSLAVVKAAVLQVLTVMKWLKVSQGQLKEMERK